MEREIVIVNIKNERIPVKKFFGKDSERFIRACCKVMENWLHPYKDCYVPKNKPALPYLKEWYKEHPDEKEKRDSSRKDWEAQRDKQFRIVYGIANHHHLYMKWCGYGTVSCGDKWVISKNGKEIALINVY